jgi:hypothetical protein
MSVEQGSFDVLVISFNSEPVLDPPPSLNNDGRVPFSAKTVDNTCHQCLSEGGKIVTGSAGVIEGEDLTAVVRESGKFF